MPRRPCLAECRRSPIATAGSAACIEVMMPEGASQPMPEAAIDQAGKTRMPAA